MFTIFYYVNTFEVLYQDGGHSNITLYVFASLFYVPLWFVYDESLLIFIFPPILYLEDKRDQIKLSAIKWLLITFPSKKQEWDNYLLMPSNVIMKYRLYKPLTYMKNI